MNAVVPCFHSLDGHYRRMDQALARGEDNQGAMRRRLSGSQQQKRTERDKPTEKHRVALVFHFEKPTRMHQIPVQRIDQGDVQEAQQSHGDLQHAFAFHDDLLTKATRAGTDEPNVGIPRIWRRMLRISCSARAVNCGPLNFRVARDWPKIGSRIAWRSYRCLENLCPKGGILTNGGRPPSISG